MCEEEIFFELSGCLRADFLVQFQLRGLLGDEISIYYLHSEKEERERGSQNNSYESTGGHLRQEC